MHLSAATATFPQLGRFKGSHLEYAANTDWCSNRTCFQYGRSSNTICVSDWHDRLPYSGWKRSCIVFERCFAARGAGNVCTAYLKWDARCRYHQEEIRTSVRRKHKPTPTDHASLWWFFEKRAGCWSASTHQISAAWRLSDPIHPQTYKP